MSLSASISKTRTYVEAAQELRENPGQLAAYESKGNCVVLAGPGSGKTKTLTLKMARMLHEDVQSPRGIACITFNNECVRELERRLLQLGIRRGHRIFIGTMHSFCLTFLVLPFAKIAGLDVPSPLRIATRKQCEDAMQEVMEAFGLYGTPHEHLAMVARHRRTVLDRNSPAWRDSRLSALVEAYEQNLRKRGVIDFDDMALVGLQLIEQHEWVRRAILARFPILVIDEYQDLGAPLHRLVLQLMDAGVRIFAVGDPDQSIYRFNGAQPELLLELANLKCVETIELTYNYRCGHTIINASIGALGEERSYQARNDRQGTVDVYECPGGLTDQARKVFDDIIPRALEHGNRKLGDVAVLYPTQFEGNVMAQAATARGYRYVRIDNGAPYPKTPITRWLEDCAAWCSGGWVSNDPPLAFIYQQWLAFNRTLPSGSRKHEHWKGVMAFLWQHRQPDLSLAKWLTELESAFLSSLFQREETLADEAQAFATLRHAAAKHPLIRNWTIRDFALQGGSPDSLNLMTLHSAKGLEFDVVILVGMDEGALPRWNAETPEDFLEARRLFYVGLTRAKSEVHITYSGFTENSQGRRFARGPTRFLREVLSRLGQA